MQYLMALAVGAGAGVFAFFLFAPLFQWVCSKSFAAVLVTSEDERRFHAVYSMMSEAQRLSLIDHHMQKLGCSRELAMRVCYRGSRARYQQMVSCSMDFTGHNA
jgi:hypothetical protein